MKTPPIILASQSPRRRILLNQIGFRFRVIPSGVGESFRHGESARSNALRIALEKAIDVASGRRRGVVVGADTIVVIDGVMLGKPTSPADARRMLRLLSGREHVVLTAFALIDCSTGRRVTGIEKTKVRFRNLSAKEIRSYVASGSPMDKAGAYGIQDDYGAVFVESVNGCFYNVVGFPLARFFVTFTNFMRQIQTRSGKRKPHGT
ncbi:MAG: nucleoside triphosphate pyrophosphatase [Bacteroidota bacterium]